MPNNVTTLYQTKVVPRLYRQLAVGLTSRWMEDNAFGVNYRGGKYIEMEDIRVSGLGNYDRDLGYPRGVITGEKKQYELTHDRGRDFVIDAADHDETGFLVNAGNVMAAFQEQHVIPEIDSTRYSAIRAAVAADPVGATHIADLATGTGALTPLEQFLADKDELEDKVGAQNLVAIMPTTTRRLFGADFEKMINVREFRDGKIYTTVHEVDGVPIQYVPSARFKTAYTFRDGVSPNQVDGGYVPAAKAKDMVYMLIPRRAPVAVAKIDKSRVFTPEEYQTMHAWKVDYRIYHDLWVRPEFITSIYIKTKA